MLRAECYLTPAAGGFAVCVRRQAGIRPGCASIFLRGFYATNQANDRGFRKTFTGMLIILTRVESDSPAMLSRHATKVGIHAFGGANKGVDGGPSPAMTVGATA